MGTGDSTHPGSVSRYLLERTGRLDRATLGSLQ